MTRAARRGPVIAMGTSQDVDAVAALIADAFTPLPTSRWLVVDDGRSLKRARVLRKVFTIHVGHAVEYGLVLVIADPAVPHQIAAAAVWFPDGAGTPPPADYDDRLTYAAGPWVERFRTLDAVMRAAHPGYRHQHLAFLAVDPARQGIGLGTALLRHHHHTLDHDRTPAYLEASSQTSRDLYTRHGYHPIGVPIALPGGPDPAMWPMWREPRPDNPENP